MSSTLIVLGNGFDLYCHLPTKYSDFFTSKDAMYGTMAVKLKNACGTTTSQKPSLNVWDAFFALNKNEMNPKWCDIEALISHSLIKGDMTSNVNWDSIVDCVCFTQNALPSNSLRSEEQTISNYIKSFYTSSQIPINKKTLYEKMRPTEKRKFFYFLSEQLNDFEKEFGKYILNVSKKCPTYETSAKKAIHALCLKCGVSDSDIVIDTFNYTDFSYGTGPRINHINGNTDLPVFGIDSEGVDGKRIDSNDPRSFFTKDVRRIGNKTCCTSIPYIYNFDNVIFFGSSLSVADYFYFFQILESFQKRWVSDRSFSGKLFFLYSTSYESDESNKKFQRLLHIGNVRKLFQSYAEYSKIEGANRLFGMNYNKENIVIESID